MVEIQSDSNEKSNAEMISSTRNCATIASRLRHNGLRAELAGFATTDCIRKLIMRRTRASHVSPTKSKIRIWNFMRLRTRDLENNAIDSENATIENVRHRR
eukprot:g18443.t1